MKEVKIAFLFLFCIGFVSATGFFDEGFGRMTGNVVAIDTQSYIDAFDCEDFKMKFSEEYIGTEIPKGIPFGDDIFDAYIDNQFLISLELKERKINGINCGESEDVGYKIYVSKKLIDEIASGELGDDVVGIYNEKKKSGDLRIEAVGFGNRLKLGFINFGLKIASWFN